MGYFIIVGILLAITILGFLAGKAIKAENVPGNKGGLVQGLTLGVGILLILVVTVFRSFHTVDNGHIGIVKQFGNLVGTTTSGLVTTLPWQSIAEVSVRNELRTYDMGRNNSAVSSDSQPVFLVVQINYSLLRSGAVQLYKNTGGQYVDRILDPAVFQDVKEVTAAYRAVDFAANREEIRVKIERKLQAEVGTIKDEDTGKTVPAIRVNSVALKNVDFTDALKQAIEATVEANQNAKRAEAQVAIKRAEANQVVATAQGAAEAKVTAARAAATSTLVQARADAEAQRLKQKTLTPALLTQAAIDKLNPNVQVIVCERGQVCVPNAVIATAQGAGK